MKVFHLYYTYENNSVRIKICNSDGKLIADVTDMLMKVEKQPAHFTIPRKITYVHLYAGTIYVEVQVVI